MGKTIVARAPVEKPPFTLSQIKKAIPPHCFKRSILTSFYYVFVDVAFIALFFAFAIKVIPALPPQLRLVAWPLYWVCQGCIFTGLWMLGHDCGHHAFSDYILLDDIVGFILHSFLLTPYYSWKISHRHHHNNTQSMDDDEIYVPKLKESLQWFKRWKIMHNPVGQFVNLFLLFVFGYPMYLVFNFDGKNYSRFTSHYDPYSPLYTKEERGKIVLSDLGVSAFMYGAYWLATSSYGSGLWWMFNLYVMPLLVLNTCVVWITYLHHTHPGLPHYDSTEWDYLRGALSTVDRDYGKLLNRVFHNITDSHVVHHIISTMPHYHGVEATKAIKPLLGDYYRFDGTPVLKALWRDSAACIYAQESKEKKGVYWYNNEF